MATTHTGLAETLANTVPHCPVCSSKGVKNQCQSPTMFGMRRCALQRGYGDENMDDKPTVR